MKKILLTFCILHFAFCISTAQQPFQKVIVFDSYSSGNAIDVYNGGHITAGLATDSLLSFGAYLLKTDENGNHLWNRLYRYQQSGSGEYVLATSDGGFVMVGKFTNFLNGTDSTFILKTDVAGNLLWSNIFYYGQGEKCIPTSLTETSDDGYIVTGNYNDQAGFPNDLPYIFKTDVNGNLLWAKRYEDAIDSYVYINDVVEDVTGNFYVIGKNHFMTEGQFLMKTNSTGSLQWMHTYKAPGMEFTFPLQISQRIDNTLDLVFAELFTSPSDQMLNIHTDASGVLLDARQYSLTNQTGIFNQVVKSSDVELIATGSFFSTGAFNSDAVIMKLNLSTGNILWTNAYGSTGYDGGSDIKTDASGNLVMTGFTEADSLLQFAGGTPTDIYYLKKKCKWKHSMQQHTTGNNFNKLYNDRFHIIIN